MRTLTAFIAAMLAATAFARGTPEISFETTASTGRTTERLRSKGIEAFMAEVWTNDVAAQGASGGFFDPPCRKWWDFLPPRMIARKLSARMNRGRYRLAHFEQGELRSRSELFTPSATQGGDFVPP